MLHNCPTCGLLVRTHNKACRHCAAADDAKRARELAEQKRAALEWALVGETPVNWGAAVADSTPRSELDIIASREEEVREQKRTRGMRL